MQSVELGCDHLEFSPVLLVSETRPVIIITHSCLPICIQVILLQTASTVLVGALGCVSVQLQANVCQSPGCAHYSLSCSNSGAPTLCTCHCCYTLIRLSFPREALRFSRSKGPSRLLPLDSLSPVPPSAVISCLPKHIPTRVFLKRLFSYNSQDPLSTFTSQHNPQTLLRVSHLAYCPSHRILFMMTSGQQFQPRFPTQVLEFSVIYRHTPASKALGSLRKEKSEFKPHLSYEDMAHKIISLFLYSFECPTSRKQSVYPKSGFSESFVICFFCLFLDLNCGIYPWSAQSTFTKNSAGSLQQKSCLSIDALLNSLSFALNITQTASCKNPIDPV